MASASGDPGMMAQGLPTKYFGEQRARLTLANQPPPVSGIRELLGMRASPEPGTAEFCGTGYLVGGLSWVVSASVGVRVAVLWGLHSIIESVEDGREMGTTPQAYLVQGSERNMESRRGSSVEGAAGMLFFDDEYRWWRREKRRLGRVSFASLHGTPAKTNEGE